MSDDRPDPNSAQSLDDLEAYLRRGGAEALAWVRKHWGPLTTRLAMLNIAIEDRLSQTRARNYPPLVFIAYKWEGDAHNAWVAGVADYLRHRGWQVMLDREHLDPGASNFLEVPAYIAGIVSCDYFLAVVSDRYLEFVEERNNQTTWVHDEYGIASRLRAAGKLRMQPVWKNFKRQPEKLYLRLNAIDLRAHPDRLELLDAAFPVYAGPVLAPVDRQALEQFMRSFDEGFAGDDASFLGQLLDDHRAFEALYDYRIRAVRFLWRARQIESAYSIALEIRDDSIEDDDILQLAYVFDAAGDHPTMFRFLYTARSRHRLQQSIIYHYFVAETLRECNSVFAALNHFRWLRRSEVWPNLTENLRNSIDAAIQELDATVREIAADHTFRCTVCSATYVHAGPLKAVCGDCGTLYETSESRCPICQNDGTVPLRFLLHGATPSGISVECPICNEGKLECVAE